MVNRRDKKSSPNGEDFVRSESPLTDVAIHNEFFKGTQINLESNVNQIHTFLSIADMNSLYHYCKQIRFFDSVRSESPLSDVLIHMNFLKGLRSIWNRMLIKSIHSYPKLI